MVIFELMRKKNLFLAIAVVFVFGIACEDPKKNAIQPTSTIPCLEHLDSNTFDLTQLETQRMNIVTRVAVGSLVTKPITPNSPDFSSLQISNDGKSITRIKPGFTSPPRTFKIEGKIFYFGDDQSEIIGCSSNGFKLFSFGSDFNEQDSTVTGMWGTYVKR